MHAPTQPSLDLMDMVWEKHT